MSDGTAIDCTCKCRCCRRKARDGTNRGRLATTWSADKGRFVTEWRADNWPRQ